ncbi:MAG: TatD family hydrolase [Gemmatimonadota bacterium]|nr:MAG: TatD family hydrolase [Gemmatimonadota bacterium]
MRFFDSHAHLTDQSFATEVADVLERAAREGVDSIACIASDPIDARAALDLARSSTRPRLWATVGVHPHIAGIWSAEALAELERLAAAAEVVAIGETGLDFHYDNAPRREQIEAFRAQIELAERLSLPVVVHSRQADDETAEIIREHAGRVLGVLHCFSGGPGLLAAGLETDWYVSFSGIVSFKSFADEAAVRSVPLERLLIETDSPYLAPVPMRGRRNEPSFVTHVAARVAEIRGEAVGRIAEATHENACRFYRIPG